MSDDNQWRISRSGYSIKTGWGDDKQIIAQCNTKNDVEFVAWLENAEKIVELYNQSLTVCQWTHDTDTGSWDGSCGVKWVFTADGPVENEVKFCPGCGQRVEVSE